MSTAVDLLDIVRQRTAYEELEERRRKGTRFTREEWETICECPYCGYEIAFARAVYHSWFARDDRVHVEACRSQGANLRELIWAIQALREFDGPMTCRCFRGKRNGSPTEHVGKTRAHFEDRLRDHWDWSANGGGWSKKGIVKAVKEELAARGMDPLTDEELALNPHAEAAG